MLFRSPSTGLTASGIRPAALAGRAAPGPRALRSTISASRASLRWSPVSGLSRVVPDRGRAFPPAAPRSSAALARSVTGRQAVSVSAAGGTDPDGGQPHQHVSVASGGRFRLCAWATAVREPRGPREGARYPNIAASGRERDTHASCRGTHGACSGAAGGLTRSIMTPRLSGSGESAKSTRSSPLTPDLGAGWPVRRRSNPAVGRIRACGEAVEGGGWGGPRRKAVRWVALAAGRSARRAQSGQHKPRPPVSVVRWHARRGARAGRGDAVDWAHLALAQRRPRCARWWRAAVCSPGAEVVRRTAASVAGTDRIKATAYRRPPTSTICGDGPLAGWSDLGHSQRARPDRSAPPTPRAPPAATGPKPTPATCPETPDPGPRRHP